MEMPIQDKARCDELSNSIAEIFNAPSIDIVRCKECKYWWNEYGDSACMLHSDFTVNDDDFCSYGEREGE